jgi:hypothetical protein
MDGRVVGGRGDFPGAWNVTRGRDSTPEKERAG